MQRALKLSLTICAIILFSLTLISILYHPILAQEGGEGGSGENNESNDRGGTGDHCVGDRGRDRDREGNECRPDPNPPCTDYLNSLPPELALFQPAVRGTCPAGGAETGYTYKICRDTCDNSLWLQNHGPICTANEIAPPPVQEPPPPPAAQEPTPAPIHSYICEEINPPPGTVGKQLQLKYLKCGLR